MALGLDIIVTIHTFAWVHLTQNLVSCSDISGNKYTTDISNT